GVSGGYGEHLVVTAGLVIHLEHADGADVDEHTGEQRLGKEHEHVERVTVVSEGVLDEAVIGGVLHRGVEVAIELDSAGLSIDLVIVACLWMELDSGLLFNRYHYIIVYVTELYTS